jgi:aspartate aminotransferase
MTDHPRHRDGQMGIAIDQSRCPETGTAGNAAIIEHGYLSPCLLQRHCTGQSDHSGTDHRNIDSRSTAHNFGFSSHMCCIRLQSQITYTDNRRIAMTQISLIAAGLPASQIREITELALTRPGVLRLEIGEPCFETPPHIVEAAAKAAREGHTRYTAGPGIASLREAISDKLLRINGLQVEPGRVLVSHGAMSGLLTSFAAVLQPGDEVLLPDPGWPNWEMMVRLFGGIPRPYALGPEAGFAPDLTALEAAIGPRTRVLLINSPSNPTGAVFSANMIERLVAIARKHDLWLISDECYDEICFDAPHVSPARFDHDGRVISVFSCSKTYAMTGWRVGYVAAPPALYGTLAKLQQPVLASVSAVSQMAALAALTGPQQCVSEMRDHYRARRDQAVALLAKRNASQYVPDGAFYVMVDVKRDSALFARELLGDMNVAVAPGTAFGQNAKNHVRVALCVAADELADGLSAILSRI